MIVRRNLNVTLVNSQSANTSHSAKILAETMDSKPILEHWDVIARSIPPNYESYSLELLRAVVTLWITIRGHCFAEGWTMKFEKKYSKGVRKTLST